MAVSVRLSDDLVTVAQIYAEAELRTIPKQIEYWARIGRIMIDNPDLSYEFVSETLLADAEVKQGTVKPYVRRTQSKS
ncbi:hypothetical protein C9J21_18300 [Photobacterium phosphoreum]|uniref:TA system antitoxin ParD family protein n=1 Tax=Photobacterium phosphoreum TaxID=659 RepID=UPI000D15317E|nr:hypothetical protein [Photobacterium phosphoreum]PSW30839.1 hypothetical protein C9J21_18300 [Photobacterium phosphoreum]